MDIPIPSPELPPFDGRKIPKVSTQLQPHIIKVENALLNPTDVEFLKKNGLYSAKKEEKVFLGGNEAEMFFVDDIHNMRMTIKDGAPAIIFHQVPVKAPPSTWVLSFRRPDEKESAKKNFLTIMTSDELRAVAKAIVSGVSGDVNRGFLQETYEDYNDDTEFPVFLPQQIIDWPKKLEEAKRQIEELKRKIDALVAERLKDRVPLTQTAGGSPPGPPPRNTAVAASDSGEPPNEESLARNIVILGGLLTVAILALYLKFFAK